MKQKDFYWHVHHSILLEYCYDYDERVEYIKKDKPKNEIETRLRLLKPVKGKLPDELIEVWQKYNEAWQKYNEARQKYAEARQKYNKVWQKYAEARQKYNKAWQKCNEALQKHSSFMEKLHAKECGCKEWNGEKLVFE